MTDAVHNLAKPFSTGRAERFLKDLANLADDRAAFESFESRHADFLPAELRRPVEFAVDQVSLALGVNLSHEQRTKLVGLREQLCGLRRGLRALWTAPDDWTRLWRAFRLYQDMMQGGDHALLLTHDPPPLTLFMQAVLFMLRQADRARRCANPDCPAPYFFAKRRGQRFCITECAVPAQHESKRRWWNEHGEEWRAKWKKSRSQKKGKRG